MYFEKFARFVSLAMLAACTTGSMSTGVSNSTGISTGIVTDTITTAVGSQFSLRLGETALVQSPNVSIVFRDVTSDSRCPIGVQCVSAGNATIQVATRNASLSSTQTQLNLLANTSTPSSVSAGAVTFTFVGLTPVPQANTSIDRTQYSATFRVTSP